MEHIKWLLDKEKNGEVYSNSDCLSFVVKLFTNENKVQIWGENVGYEIHLKDLNEAVEEYINLKSKKYEEIMEYAKLNYKKSY